MIRRLRQPRIGSSLIIAKTIYTSVKIRRTIAFTHLHAEVAKITRPIQQKPKTVKSVLSEWNASGKQQPKEPYHDPSPMNY